MLLHKNTLLSFAFALGIGSTVQAQYNGAATGLVAGNYWYGKERVLRYHPEGEDFVIVNGDKKFNRALYGTHTGFRIEAGDLPEFALYMPNMGGNMQLGVIVGGQSRWMNSMQYIEFRYRPGAAIYTIKDPILSSGSITLTLLAMADQEGFILKTESNNLPEDLIFFSSFGGASHKRFSREGDLGVDPIDCFDLKPDNCIGNVFKLTNSEFSLYYGSTADQIEKLIAGDKTTEDEKRRPRQLQGVFPAGTKLQVVSPYKVTTPLDMWESIGNTERPLLGALIPQQKEFYIAIRNGDEQSNISYNDLVGGFEKAESHRKEIASSLKINTPDAYLNTLGGAVSIAADGIWDGTVWLHGAIGWRMPLSGWRAAYVGDLLGWHDRARTHFDAYSASQVTDIAPVFAHPTQDTIRNFARADKTWGTQMYSNGYISRNPNRSNIMHHYDMNLCYVDELLWHFNWTGDTEYVVKMWPTLERHLAWEKRNFDPDNDGLYDAYASIWASDALQYNSGGVTHSSAYNYRANKLAAELAVKIGKDPKPYRDEANKILKAINAKLWLPDLGRWAEYRDFMGYKEAHTEAGIWTVYHAIDSDIHDSFQAYQATRFVDTNIPHIPVRAKGLKDEGYATISTTNWFPYQWSINNVAFSEVAHMALAYWQSGRNDEAFKLFKSSILDGMYIGSSPGNCGQISFYDAARSECYRDFGDPVGTTTRAIVQGLYGIRPDYLNNRLHIVPGFPSGWNFASYETSDLLFDFKRESQTDRYKIKVKRTPKTTVKLSVKAPFDQITSIQVNGKSAKWELDENAIQTPIVHITAENVQNDLTITIVWAGNTLTTPEHASQMVQGDLLTITSAASIQGIKDPQGVLSSVKRSNSNISGKVKGEAGNRTMFVLQKQGIMRWWAPIHIDVKLKNPQDPSRNLLPHITDGTILGKEVKFELVNIDHYFNSSVCDIFQNKYMEPRSPYTTLQIPIQGIGEWCHPDMMAEIDDTGLRAKVVDNLFKTPFGLPFRISAEKKKNIVYTTLWNNYPNRVEIPLQGRAKQAYLMMAGSTNHMQVHFTNGIVRITYKDGTEEQMKLVNPQTWCPIEQDLFVDDYAFKFDALRVMRVALKTGVVSRTLQDFYKFKSAQDRTIPGGAAILLNMPLDSNKELESITVETRANDVVIGLMGITLER